MALTDHKVAVLNSPLELEWFLTRELYARLTGGTQTFPFTSGGSETLIIDGSNDGGSTWTYFQRTFTDPAPGPHANIAALLAELNTAGNWNGGTLPTEFTISNDGDKIVIQGTEAGNDYGIRVNASSTIIGAVSSTDLLFTGGVNTTGGDGGSIGLATLVDAFCDNNGKYIVVYTVV